MTKMDKGMAGAPMTGEVDHDFATMMVPDHEDAIDMANAELSYGKDPVSLIPQSGSSSTT